MNIDISHIKNRRIRTLLYCLNGIYRCELQPDDNMVDEFIDTYIQEARQLINQYTEGEYTRLSDINFVSNRNIDNDYNCGLYNICHLLVTIDRDYAGNRSILEKIELEEYDDVAELLDTKLVKLIHIQLGVSNYIIDINQSKQKFDFAKHYNVAPDIGRLIKDQRNIQRLKKYYIKQKDEHDCFASDILLFFHLSIVKRKNDIHKLLLALICICKSHEYEQYMNDYAELFIDLFQEIMFCGEIHKIYIQLRALNEEVPVSKRGSEHATTRFSIIFSAGNEDIYILRIDLPHKGEMKLHLNLHECVKDKVLSTGYPIEIEDASGLRKLSNGYFEKLFFILNNHVWFRSDFERKISEAEIQDDEKEELLKLFYDRSHYTIDMNIGNEELFIEFANELKEYLANFSLKSNMFCSFDKDTIDYTKEVKKVREYQNIIKKFSDYVIEAMNPSIAGNESFWKVFSLLGLQDVISRDEFMQMDFSRCWEFIDSHIL